MTASLSIVVPAFNEAGRVGETLRSILEYLNRTNPQAELIVVDDGSDDNTNSGMNAGGGDTDPEDDPELAYASTKMMGDADREVNYIKLTFRDFC